MKRIREKCNYRSSSVNGYSTQQAYYTLNASINKRFAEDRGTIKIGGRNILAPNNYSSVQTLPGSTVYYQSHSYYSEATVTLSWKLENSKKKKEEKMKGILGKIKD